MSTQSAAITTDDRLLTEKEAAEYLRIKVRQLYNWRVSGLIPYIRLGKALRYRKSAIDGALERFTRGGNR
jgi:excisionase family DNA binding protein